MRYEIILAPEAVDDLQTLSAKLLSQVLDGIERHLRFEPKKISKSRIKRLKGLSRPEHRLRVAAEIRVFYDVRENTVEILAIVPKSEARQWLQRHGESDEESSSL